MQNDVLAGAHDRIAQRALSQKVAESSEEVRRLLDAARTEIAERGTTSRPRVADIVARAGLSNDAFYRYFRSKDELMATLLEEGTELLCSYLVHQMAKESEPAAKVRRWVEGILAQTTDEAGVTTLTVLHNTASAADGRALGRHPASRSLAALLHEPLTALGCERPEADALVAAHAVLGVLVDHLWDRTVPTDDEADHLVTVVLRLVGAAT